MTATKEREASIAALAEAVKAAHEAWDKAKQESHAAYSAETAALNALNAAQKEFDAALATWRTKVAGEGDWRNRSRGVEVTNR